MGRIRGPARPTAFQRWMADSGLIHARIAPRRPQQNGIIERSHRTDNEELFRRERFASSEERRYRLRLWEMHYNTRRPHQGLGGLRPIDAYRADYRFHAGSRMLM